MCKRNAEILIHEDDKECDMCDTITTCVTIRTLGRDCLILCKKCIDKIHEEIHKES